MRAIMLSDQEHAARMDMVNAQGTRVNLRYAGWKDERDPGTRKPTHRATPQKNLGKP
jgi:hypothetical protein